MFPEIIEHPFFYNQEDLNLLYTSEFIKEKFILKENEQREFYYYLINNQLIPDNIKFIDYLNTFLSFYTRGYTIESVKSENEKQAALVPLADMLNHDIDNNVFYDIEENIFYMKAKKDIKAGEEVIIKLLILYKLKLTYGYYSNLSLLIGYGFTLEKNDNKDFNITIEIGGIYFEVKYNQNFQNILLPLRKKSKVEYPELSDYEIELLVFKMVKEKFEYLYLLNGKTEKVRYYITIKSGLYSNSTK